MSLLPILLVAAVMMVDGGMTPIGAEWELSRSTIQALAIGPVVLILLTAHLVFIGCDRQLKQGRSPRPFQLAERIGRWARAAIVLNHFASIMVFGWLGTVRSTLGNPILLDELVAVGPALLGFIGIWWMYFPIERRMHDSLLIRTLDEGRALYPPLSRTGYVVLQTRLHLLLVLTPVLVIAGLSEGMTRAGETYNLQSSDEWIVSIGKVAIGAGVFLLAPLMATLVLDVRPMAPGPLRHLLLDVADRHRVAVRELLVWRTNGSLFNAAVMGLIGRLRYVLITDALLETLRDDQIRAVMAHEIGHVRRRHLLWLVVCLLASFVVAGIPFGTLAYAVEQMIGWKSQAALDGFRLIISVAQLAVGLLVFGWVCRRFERQADTFAVQHLSRYPSATEREQPPETKSVTADSVHAMCDSLDAIATLNAIEHHRPSWRHGSIAWRMEYLLTLVGQPLSALAIDRVVVRIKFAAAIIVCSTIAYSAIEFWLSGRGGS